MFGLPLAGYLAVAWELVFRYASFDGDAQARLANAYYVLYSRDPHLAAVGFVWNPLPSFAVLPLVPLKVLWPALTTRAFAGNIMSAVFTAWSTYMLYEFCRELGLGRVVRISCTALYALNPMIVYYAANGMSEALFLLTLVVGARYLARWARDDGTISLVVAASALGVSYLARNEAVFAAFFASVVVVAVAYRRGRGSWRERGYRAATDAVIVSLPFVVCFVGWAVVSWIIVKHPFVQFSSVYGTTSQLRVLGETTKIPTKLVALRRALTDTAALAPLLPVLACVAVWLSVWRRDLRVLAPLSIFGGVLVFAIAAYALNKTAGWFRYYITAVPLTVMLIATIAACLLVDRTRRRRPRPRPTVTRVEIWMLARGPRLLAGLGVALVVVVAAASLPTTAWAMMDPNIGSEERQHLGYFLERKPGDAGQQEQRNLYQSTVDIAHALDGLALRHGSILVDDFTPCVSYIILNSRSPQQFVIPNDRDFERTLQDPGTFHVTYLLVPATGGFGDLDALNRQYPGLYANGGGISTLVTSYEKPGCPAFRLFKVSSAPGA